MRSHHRAHLCPSTVWQTHRTEQRVLELVRALCAALTTDRAGRATGRIVMDVAALTQLDALLDRLDAIGRHYGIRIYWKVVDRSLELLDHTRRGRGSMTLPEAGQLLIFFFLLALLSGFLGRIIYRIFEQGPPLRRLTVPLEGMLWRLAGIDPAVEHDWKGYASGLLIFNAAGLLLLYGIQRLQGWLPLNPQHIGNVAPLVAWNTAVSFTTNTDWQAYSGERTMSILTQMLGLTVQNFLSAASGIMVAVALCRGIARRSAGTLGNVWVDLTRATLWILLPLAALFALFLVWQGVPQTLGGPITARGIEGSLQVIPRGPIASQEAIKLLGTNGGGFFGANSAHPYENPTPLTNVFEALAIVLLPAALVIAFGWWVGDRRQGWALWAGVAGLLLAGMVLTAIAEQHGNPALTSLGIDQARSAWHSGGNLEGKETRFGPFGSALFATVTTAVACGAVNSAHDSMMPLSVLILLFNMQLGEVVFGGNGAGLIGILFFVLVTVFIAGLMVGRTPEYLGKKLDPTTMKFTALFILIPALSILFFTGVASIVPQSHSLAGLPGPHGFSRLLYAYTSSTANNGSAMGAFASADPFALVTTGLAMLLGRFPGLVLALALAGHWAGKQRLPASVGTLPTHSPLFVATWIAVIVIVGGLTFFPALVLGPIAEHLLLAG